ncbi:putative rna- rbd [Golovinomyces cichoracearum]|uniref:Putative rna-rbd n=1 Tax=Golovinomyces cichoracearum TaxID=62708 RepID=A0A420HIP0_9PEZI|nr:putative rna- rbd [Golovinomyces cichoracearum]
MGESVAKLQPTVDSGAGRSHDCITEASPYSIQINKIDEKEGFRNQFGSTTPVIHPVVHSCSALYQPLGCQEHFTMGALGAALPEISNQQCILGHPQYPNQVMYHIPQIQQFPGLQNLAASASHSPHYSAFEAQLQHTYTTRPNLSSSTFSNMNAGNYSYQGPALTRNVQPPSLFLQHGQYPMQNQINSGNQNVGAQFLKAEKLDNLQMNRDYHQSFRTITRGRYKTAGNLNRIQKYKIKLKWLGQRTNLSRLSCEDLPGNRVKALRFILLGHAIWIGNLPSHIDIISLVQHVCKETKDLESLFLISKSNCAFANFKNEEACTAAQQKVHDSRFQTARLVSRLRRGSSRTNFGTTVPNRPPVSTRPGSPTTARTSSPGPENNEGANAESVVEITSISVDRFFVVKSLTIEDLELSVSNGIWATQAHNEKILNEAFKKSDNVFLIFSANKSGEYFGYAKMISPINDDPAAAIEFAPMAQVASNPVLPKIIISPASGPTPKGRIIDDSARGTIFWEAERDSEGEEEETEEMESEKSVTEEPPPKAWGKPFGVEWISTVRLPFHRTKGLRNPWNSNREVKIARDGTELETSVGRKLIALFHRLPSPVPLPITGYPYP